MEMKCGAIFLFPCRRRQINPISTCCTSYSVQNPGYEVGEEGLCFEYACDQESYDPEEAGFREVDVYWKARINQTSAAAVFSASPARVTMRRAGSATWLPKNNRTRKRDS